MTIDEENAYRITKRLSFPRLVGSKGEEKAKKVVFEELKEAGYEKVESEQFKTSLFNWIFARYVFIPIAALLLITTISFYFNHWVTLIFIGLITFILIRGLSFLDSSTITLSKNEENNFETENFYTTLKNENAKGDVIFMAHWDSKSQTFPSAVRILFLSIIVVGGIALLLVLLILSIVKIFFPFENLILNHTLLIISISLSIVGLLNYFNKTGNKSPGAFDNAASVGTVIELARYYKNNPLSHLNCTFLSTSSEELNLGGAKTFIQYHADEFDKDTTYFINFDGIGGSGFIRLITSYGIPRKSSSNELNRLFNNTAEELDIDLRDIYLPTGAWSDFMPMVKKGFKACWLASNPGLKYVHTPKDTMDLVSKKGLKNGLILTTKVVEKLDLQYS
ncbi:MAG: M28 family metallopeptidase [Promethearchaeia archaeon]